MGRWALARRPYAALTGGTGSRMVGTLGDMAIATVRELARRFSAEELDRCLNAEISTGANVCVDEEGGTGEVVNTLAEAEFVRELVEQGVPLTDAIRELARRIRAFQRAEGDEPVS
jgi:hypothetical protein